MKVHFSEPLLYRLEGTSAKIPLERAENKPLFSRPLWLGLLGLLEALLILAFILYDILDSAGTLILKGRDSSFKSSSYWARLSWRSLLLSSSFTPELSSFYALTTFSLRMVWALTMTVMKLRRVTLPSLFFSVSAQSSSATSGLNYPMPAFFWQIESRACLSSRSCNLDWSL